MGYDWCELREQNAALQQQFAEHVSRHGLSYGTTDEYNFRYELFSKKDAEINRINAKYDSFTVGHNKFSTWTDYEFKRLLGYRPLGPSESVKDHVMLDDANLTSSVDWRDMNAVNAVKD